MAWSYRPDVTKPYPHWHYRNDRKRLDGFIWYGGDGRWYASVSVNGPKRYSRGFRQVRLARQWVQSSGELERPRDSWGN